MNKPDSKIYKANHWKNQKESGYRRVSVTLSGDEYKRMETEAKKHEVTVTAHLKALALAHLDNEYLIPENMEKRMDELIAILRGVGNNLNQLARHSNEMKYFLDTQEVRLQLKRMDESIREFITHPPSIQK